MSIAINYNDYKNGKIKEWMMEQASENLPKHFLFEIQNLIGETKSLNIFPEFNIWFVPRLLTEDWKYVSRKRFLSDENFPNWCNSLGCGDRINFCHHKILSIHLDEIPENIGLLDVIISKKDLNHKYCFGEIVLDFMTSDKLIKTKYSYNLEWTNSSIIFLGILARSDADEWKFFPMFHEYSGNIMLKGDIL